MNVVQVEQDFALCRMKFPAMTCRPIGAKFMGDDLIALFEFEKTDADVAVVGEKHYRLVPLDDLSREELLAYRSRLT